MSWHAGYSFIFQLLASRNSSPTRKEILSKSVPDKGLFARGTSFKPIQMKNDFITCYICHFLTNCNQKLKLCQCTAGVPELFTSKEIELCSIAKSNLSFQVCILTKFSFYFGLLFFLWNNSMFAHNLHDTRMQLLQPLVPFPSFSNQTNDFLWLFLSHEKEFFPLPKFRDVGFYYPPFLPSNNSHESQFRTGIPEAKIATLVLKSRWSGHVSLPTKIMPCGYLFDEFTVKASDLNSP